MSNTLASAQEIDLALRRVGEQLAFDRVRFAVAILGGAALNLLGIVQRPTVDVDVLAFATEGQDGGPLALQEPPEPIPEDLERAITTVAHDLNIDVHWMNTGPALQWQQGLPPGLATRITWRHYGPADAPDVGLDVGLVARYDLIFFKLYAAADHANTRSVHYRDLLALAPTRGELDAAAAWVRRQDVAPEFHAILDQLIAHVERQLTHE
jgi:hypothetical protein